MQVYIVRHAQTQGNLTRRLQGSGTAYAGLTEQGRREAQALATYLKAFGPPIAEIYSSDATRAQQTAAVLAATLALPVQLDPALQEINCGVWEGKSHDELVQLHPDEWSHWQNDPLTFCFPKGEGLLDVQRRVGVFFDSLIEEKPIGNVLLVSHSATISTLMAYVHGWDLLEAWSEGRAMHRNTAFSVLTFDAISNKLIDSKIAVADHLSVQL